MLFPILNQIFFISFGKEQGARSRGRGEAQLVDTGRCVSNGKGLENGV